MTAGGVYLLVGSQKNSLPGGYIEVLLTGKCLWRSHWTSVNMTEDVIELYHMFNTKGFPEDLIFGDSIDQPIPFNYSGITNDYDDNGTQIDAALTENEGVEDAVVQND